MPIAQEVREFLLEFKRAVTSRGGVMLVSRRETLSTLAALGLTKANLKEIFLSLSMRDYCKGPEPERNRSQHVRGSVWVVGKRIENQEVYIKLKLFTVGDATHAKCISFHFTERPLHYPHRH